MQSIDRLMEVLDRLSQSEEGVRISVLRAELNLPLASLYRLLQGLVEHGLVYQDPDTKRYLLGIRLLRLAERVKWPEALKKAVHPVLTNLRDQFGETVFVAAYIGGDVVCIDKAEGTNRVRYFAEVGALMPVHATAAGKAVAAYLAPEQVRRSLKNGLVAYSPTTIVSWEQLQVDFASVRANGYALCLTEFEPGIWAVASPIFEPAGGVIASLCLLGSEGHINAERKQAAIAAVREATLSVTARLRGPSKGNS